MIYRDPKTGKMVHIGRNNAATPLLDEAARMTKRLSVEDLNDRGCQRLAEVVVSGMVREYREARRNKMKFPFDRQTDANYKEARQNILSEQFARLSMLDGREIIKKIDHMRG